MLPLMPLSFYWTLRFNERTLSNRRFAWQMHQNTREDVAKQGKNADSIYSASCLINKSLRIAS